MDACRDWNLYKYLFHINNRFCSIVPLHSKMGSSNEEPLFKTPCKGTNASGPQSHVKDRNLESKVFVFFHWK